MKKNVFYLLAGILLYSCSLKEKSIGFYSDDNFYKTPEDAQSALYYVYNTFTFNEYARAIFYINELGTDALDVKGEEGFGSQEINRWDFNTFKNNEQLELFYKYSYIAINRANAVIENTEKSSINQDIKNRIVGEAYFLRAWTHYQLVQLFGLVPLQKSAVKTVSQTTPAMAKSMNEVYDFLIADAHHAEELLSIHRMAGTADKVAAQSLLAKLYLSIASSKESNVSLYRDMGKDVNQMYDSAAYWADKVLNGQQEYKLDADLLNVYDVSKPTGAEHIFLLSMDKSGINEGNFSSIDKMFIPYNNGGSVWFPNPDGSFTKSTDQGWGVFRITDAYAAAFNTNDFRKKWLMSKKIYNNASGTDSYEHSNYLTRKYIDPNYTGGKSSTKPFLIRFSEVALIYAEAKGPTPEAYNWLNKIRKRASVTDAPTGLSAKDFRTFVVNERGFELAFEGKRLHDLRRKAWVLTKDPRAAASGISEAQAAYYPIPQKEIDLNPNL